MFSTFNSIGIFLKVFTSFCLLLRHLLVDDDSPCPPDRAFSQIAAFDRYVYAYGGAYRVNVALDPIMADHCSWQSNRKETMSDTWRFDKHTRTWIKMETTGDHPPGLVHHTLIKWGPDTLLLYGGLVDYAKQGKFE